MTSFEEGLPAVISPKHEARALGQKQTLGSHQNRLVHWR